MERRNVQLRVGGQSYRVLTTATDAELKRCVAAIDERLNEVNPKGRAPHPQALFLAMLGLVNELEEARAAATLAQAAARETLDGVLRRIDAALEEGAGRDDDGDQAANGAGSPDAAPSHAPDP
jgi:cell division protein ZapA